MRVFWQSFFATILAIVVTALVAGGIVVSRSDSKKKIDDRSWLVVDLYGAIDEYDPPAGILGAVGGGGETLQRVLGNLEKAAVDKRIDGVVMKISGSNGAGRAMLEEMRGAVKKVRGAGKKVHCWSDDMNRNAYYLASACDSIWLAPPANVQFIGMGSGSMHIKGTLEKLGIKPNLHQIKEYKAAAEMMTRSNMSPEARENDKWLLEEFWSMFVKALDEDRGLTEERIVETMDLAVMTADEAKVAGLVDGIIYWDELERKLARKEGEDLRAVTQSAYAGVKPEKVGLKGKKRIAVVHAHGMIGGRKSRIDPLFGVMMGHESVVADLRKAAKDKDVAAIVFRVDSPGGEGLASDLIGHEVAIVSEKKPVVASMVDVAGSGGYYISYQATKIVADPMTITGSIGSISMKFNMKGLYDKMGVTQDNVTKGPMALLMSDYRDFTPEERARFERNHWNGFNRWLEDVARRRGMTFDEAQKLAHGRVWSGRQAKENGLVDELGGLDRAIEIAKELAKIPADEKVTVVHFPKKKSLLEVVTGDGGGIAAAANYAARRFIRENLADAWRMLNGNSLYLMDDASTR
jgi:protease-4